MNELIRQTAKKLDDQLDFKKMVGGIAGTLLEFFDGKIFEAALTFGVAKIPENLHDEVEVILKAYISGDYSQLSVESIKRINEAIDIPVLDEEDEEIIISSIVNAFLKIVQKKL